MHALNCNGLEVPLTGESRGALFHVCFKIQSSFSPSEDTQEEEEKKLTTNSQFTLFIQNSFYWRRITTLSSS